MLFAGLALVYLVSCEKDPIDPNPVDPNPVDTTTNGGSDSTNIDTVMVLSLSMEIEHLIFEKTNALRDSIGLAALTRTEDGDTLAGLHSFNMVEYDFFSHTDHLGRTPSDRANDLSISFSSLAENIVYVPWFSNVSSCGDTRSAEAMSNCMMNAWENSSGHYSNIIGAYDYIGIGVYYDDDSIFYATQVFYKN